MNAQALCEETTVLASTIARPRGRRSEQASVAESRQPSGVARLLALAHHLQGAIDCGVVSDRAALARAFGLSRARVTQVLDLLLLAPDIQEAVLASEAINSAEPIRERDLRKMCGLTDWEAQRERVANGKVRHAQKRREVDPLRNEPR